MTNRVGQQFGSYRLTALLDQGSFAEVYLGRHVRLELQAAIKVLHTHLTGKEAEQFYQEAQTLAKLVHPAIVRVFDYDVQEGVPFLVMDYAPGGSLCRRYPRGTVVPFPQILASVQQVAAALQYAHEHKVIHCDVKPENMLVGRHQQVLLSDFGLAALAHSTASEVAQGTVGTIAYMAPEQIEGHPRAASDQYALGVTVYEWLCGQCPFQGSLSQVMVQHLSLPPPALRERVPTISPKVEQLVLRALAKDPKQRFACVADFAQALEQAWREEVSGQTLPLPASARSAEAGHRVTSKPHLPAGTLTFLFTDIERSTQLLQRLGERYANVLSECRHLLRATFQQWHGHEIDTQGDAFFVVFARATDAVSAAVAAQRALASHTWPQSVAVRVRMGLHTGEPQLTAEGYVGLDVHRAARIMSAGHGGQVLLSQTTRDLVEHALPEGVSLLEVGVHRLKDLQQPSRLFQVVIAGCQASFPPLKTLDIQLNNLPIQLTPFLGREQEVANISDLLRRPEVRLVTLTGTGGVGKTRLGLAVACTVQNRFPDGVCFVPLAPVSDPERVIATIAQTLGLWEAGDCPLLEQVQDYLREKHLLLLLDNFEQVIAAAPQLVDLLVSCPHLSILVTSRATLHLSGEHEFAVSPLAVPDLTQLPACAALAHVATVRLFVERAQSVKADFQLTEANAHAIAEICVRLDGLPLAIELAAARAKVFPPQTLLSRLEHGLAALTGGARDLPVRQQTLRGTIAWSYNLLSPEEQQLFRRLAVFVDGCTWEAAEQVCMEAGVLQGDILDGLASLVDKSLLRQKESAESEPRFWMLRLLREFGLECLASAGETQATCNGHALYYLQLSEEAELQIKGAQQSIWLERLEREHNNVRAALYWLVEQEEAALALQMSAALWWFWYMRGYLSEGRRWLEIALEQRTMQERTSTRAKALCGLGQLILYQGDHTASGSLFEESIGLFRELGDKKGLARSLLFLAKIRVLQGNDAAARALSEESVALCREVGDKWELAVSLNELGCIVYKQGDDAAAYALFEETMLLCHQVGNRWALSRPLANLGHLAWSKGNIAQAAELYKESLAIGREMSDKLCIAFVLNMLGDIALSQNEDVRAAALFEESFSVAQELRSKELIGWSFTGLAAAKGGEELQEKVIQRFEIAWAQGHLITAEQALAAQGDAVVPKRLFVVPRSRPYRHPVGGFFEGMCQN